jgi:hypothetical protein
MMSLQADGDCEVFLFGQFVGVDDFADTGRVNGDGFFHEHVLTGVDCGFEVQRTEAGGVARMTISTSDASTFL